MLDPVNNSMVVRFSIQIDQLQFLPLVRPLHIQWVSENERTATAEIERLEREEANLVNFHPIQIPGMEVQYNGLWTMLDGKDFFHTSWHSNKLAALDYPI